MPFTLSHAVLAPPLAKLSGKRLPVAALAIGCMAPDLYRLFTSENLTISHEWSGLIVPDLFIGLFFCVLWYGLYRPMIYPWLKLKDDLTIGSVDRACGFILYSIIALILGSITHLIWDGLTHADYRTLIFPNLLERDISIFGLHTHVSMLMQVGSSALTLPVLLWMCIQYRRKHLQINSSKPEQTSIQRFCFIGFTIATLAGLYLTYHFAPHDLNAWESNTYEFVGRSINNFFRGFLAIFSLWAVLFLIRFGFYKSTIYNN